MTVPAMATEKAERPDIAVCRNRGGRLLAGGCSVPQTTVGDLMQFTILASRTIFTFSLAVSLYVNANAADCYESSITSPTPFMGNNDEIFKLSDGSVWQIKYEYEYLYEYNPSVTICPDIGRLLIGGKSLQVAQI